MIYDAVIIGAGPAGLTCGITLQKSGMNVLILEKENGLSPKICAGLLDDVAENVITKVLGELPDSLFSQPNMYISPQVYYDRRLIINSREKEKNLDRLEFDKWMLGMYKGDIEFGADCFDFTKTPDRNIKIHYLKNNLNYTVEAAILADASGYSSSVIRKVFPQEFSDVKKIYLSQIAFSDTAKLDTNKMYMFLKKHSFLNYLVPKNGIWHHGLGGADESELETTVAYYTDFLRDYFGCCFNIVGRIQRYATDIWINPLYGKENIVAIGEAAGLWGKCGDGIRFGVQSGYLCARGIIDAENSEKAADKYIEYCKKENMTEKIVLGHGNANALNRFHRKVDKASMGIPGIYRKG